MIQDNTLKRLSIPTRKDRCSDRDRNRDKSKDRSGFRYTGTGSEDGYHSRAWKSHKGI